MSTVKRKASELVSSKSPKKERTLSSVASDDSSENLKRKAAASPQLVSSKSSKRERILPPLPIWHSRENEVLELTVANDSTLTVRVVLDPACTKYIGSWYSPLHVWLSKGPDYKARGAGQDNFLVTQENSNDQEVDCKFTVKTSGEYYLSLWGGRVWQGASALPNATEHKHCRLLITCDTKDEKVMATPPEILASSETDSAASTGGFGSVFYNTLAATGRTLQKATTNAPSVAVPSAVPVTLPFTEQQAPNEAPPVAAPSASSWSSPASSGSSVDEEPKKALPQATTVAPPVVVPSAEPAPNEALPAAAPSALSYFRPASTGSSVDATGSSVDEKEKEADAAAPTSGIGSYVRDTAVAAVGNVVKVAKGTIAAADDFTNNPLVQMALPYAPPPVQAAARKIAIFIFIFP